MPLTLWHSECHSESAGPSRSAEGGCVSPQFQTWVVVCLFSAQWEHVHLLPRPKYNRKEKPPKNKRSTCDFAPHPFASPRCLSGPCQLLGTQRQTPSRLGPPGASRGHQEEAQPARNHHPPWQGQKEPGFPRREAGELPAPSRKTTETRGRGQRGPGGGIGGVPSRQEWEERSRRAKDE